MKSYYNTEELYKFVLLLKLYYFFKCNIEIFAWYLYTFWLKQDSHGEQTLA